MKKSLREKLFISKPLWITIQILFLTIGMILMFYIGLIIAIHTGFIDVPFLLVLIYDILYMCLKYKIEDEFSDVIDS